jgi:RNA polymerase sigma-70 factor (ECF subfamily)
LTMHAASASPSTIGRGVMDGRADDAVQRARLGDSRAFEQVYRQHVGRIYAVILRMTADPALTDELTQAAFVRAWQKLSTFRGESSFGTWLHRLAVHVVLADRRSHGRRIVALAPDGNMDGPAKTPPHPGVRMDLEAALETLPPQARHVFVLHDIEGWSHEDIAAALGVVVGTTKSQLHRARALLREVLG